MAHLPQVCVESQWVVFTLNWVNGYGSLWVIVFCYILFTKLTYPSQIVLGNAFVCMQTLKGVWPRGGMMTSALLLTQPQWFLFPR